MDALAVGELEAQRVEAAARHRRPPGGSLLGVASSVKKTLCPALLAAELVTSPSTQSVGRRVSQRATPRLNEATVYTLRSPYSIASSHRPPALHEAKFDPVSAALFRRTFASLRGGFAAPRANGSAMGTLQVRMAAGACRAAVLPRGSSGERLLRE